MNLSQGPPEGYKKHRGFRVQGHHKRGPCEPPLWDPYVDVLLRLVEGFKDSRLGASMLHDLRATSWKLQVKRTSRKIIPRGRQAEAKVKSVRS